MLRKTRMISRIGKSAKISLNPCPSYMYDMARLAIKMANPKT